MPHKVFLKTRSACWCLPLRLTLRTPRNMLVQSCTGQIRVISAPAQFVRVLGARILQVFERSPHANFLISQFLLLIARHYMILRCACPTDCLFTNRQIRMPRERSIALRQPAQTANRDLLRNQNSALVSRMAVLRIRDTPDAPGSSSGIGPTVVVRSFSRALSLARRDDSF